MKDWYNIVVCNLWWFWHLGHSSSIQWAVLIQIRFTKQRWYQILAKYILYAKLKQQKLFTMPCRCNMAMVFGDQALICWTRPLLLLPTDGGSTQEFSFKNPNALPPYVPARRALWEFQREKSALPKSFPPNGRGKVHLPTAIPATMSMLIIQEPLSYEVYLLVYIEGWEPFSPCHHQKPKTIRSRWTKWEFLIPLPPCQANLMNHVNQVKQANQVNLVLKFGIKIRWKRWIG